MSLSDFTTTTAMFHILWAESFVSLIVEHGFHWIFTT